MALSLTDRIVRLHRSLDVGGLAHAFGGALALAYCTEDPRGTNDIDVNVFVGTEGTDAVVAALPKGVLVTDEDRHVLTRDAQRRLWWEGTPVDLFLTNHAFHDEAQQRCRSVPFAGVADLPVLACEDLAVFKGFFARPKDAVDLATMLEDGHLDPDRVIAEVERLLGPDDEKVAFVRNALGR
jgi:hypothetical protein